MSTDVSLDAFENALDLFEFTRPPASLRDVQALYGILAYAARGLDQFGEYGLYYHHDRLRNRYLDEDDEEENARLVTVRIDLSDSEAPEYIDTKVKPLTEELITNLDYHFRGTGRGHDYGITHGGSTTGNGADVETVRSYCESMLSTWLNYDTTETIRVDHADGWILDGLAAVGDEETFKAIGKALNAQLSGDTLVVTTVAIRLDPADYDVGVRKNRGMDWYYAGEVDVFNSAMQTRAKGKLATKNKANARGQGTCSVLGIDTEVFGTTPDPLDLFTTKHTDEFGGFDRDASWRAQPLSATAAQLINLSGALIDQCYATHNGIRVYTIPYLTTETTPELALGLYQLVDDLDATGFSQDSEESLFSAIQRNIEADNPLIAEQLRLYTLMYENNQGDVNVYGEVPAATLYGPRVVGDAHAAVTASSTLNPIAGFPAREASSGSLLRRDDGDSFAGDVLSGWYLKATCYPYEFNPKGGPNVAADDRRREFAQSLLENTAIPVDALTDEYMMRFRHERRQDDDNEPNWAQIKAQFVQYEALLAADRLMGGERESDLTHTPPEMEDSNYEAIAAQFDRLPTAPRLREYRIERFLDERPYLAKDPEQRAVFLSGALIGALSHYQRNTLNLGTGSAFDVRFNADQMTPADIEQTLPNVLQKAGTYAKKETYEGDTLFAELATRVSEAMTLRPPEQWELSPRRLRFLYSTGVVYGHNHNSAAWDLRNALAPYFEDDADEAAATQPTD